MEREKKRFLILAWYNHLENQKKIKWAYDYEELAQALKILRFLNSKVRLLCCEFVDLDSDKSCYFFAFAIAIVK